MSFYNPANMQGLQLLFRLGFDRVWFAIAVIVSLFIASRLASLLVHWIAPGPML